MTDSFILIARTKAVPAGYNDQVLYLSSDLELVEALLREGRFSDRLADEAVFAVLQTPADSLDATATPVLVGYYDRQGAGPHALAEGLDVFDQSWVTAIADENGSTTLPAALVRTLGLTPGANGQRLRWRQDETGRVFVRRMEGGPEMQVSTADRTQAAKHNQPSGRAA